MKLITNIALKFTSQKHYSEGSVDTMELIASKFSTEQYLGLVIGDVIRYVTRFLVTRNKDDLEKALTMLAWGVDRIRKETKQ